MNMWSLTPDTTVHVGAVSTLPKDKEGHIFDEYSATQQKMNEECRRNMNFAANKRTLSFTATYSKKLCCRHATYITETGNKANND